MDSSTILTCLCSNNYSPDNIRTALEWFQRKTEIFKELTLDTMKDILSTAKIVEKYPNEIIIRQGDYGDCFYVLLSGSASIYINTDPSITLKEETSERSLTFSQPKLDRSTRLNKTQIRKDGVNKFVTDTDRRVYGEFSGSYVEGSCFGELALLQHENVRNATIMTDEKCHLLVISRDLFDKAIRSNAEEMYKEKINLVNTHFLFKNRTPRFKHQIAMSLEKIKIYFSQNIIVQGQQSIGLMIFRKGEAKIVIDAKQHYSQYTAYVTQAESGDILSQDSSQSSLSARKQMWSARDNPGNFKREKIEVAIIGSNDIIGDIEFGLNFPTNLLTVTASEMCEVYLLATVHLERMFNFKRNSSTYEIFQDLAELKLNTYYNRCSSFGELPLFKLLLTEASLDTDRVNLTNQLVKATQKVNLLPVFKTGPIIDLYGPGSVFFRNKLKRKVTRKKLTNNKEDRTPAGRSMKTNIYSEDVEENIFMSREARKSIFKVQGKQNTFTDWETSSVHLNDLESRMKSWISNVTLGERCRTDLSIHSAIKRLPRFKHNDLPEEYRFKVKCKRHQNENNDDIGNKITARKDKDEENDKKIPDSIVRQYTELDYSRLKAEMKIKEKRLSIFRLKLGI